MKKKGYEFCDTIHFRIWKMKINRSNLFFNYYLIQHGTFSEWKLNFHTKEFRKKLLEKVSLVTKISFKIFELLFLI